MLHKKVNSCYVENRSFIPFPSEFLNLICAHARVKRQDDGKHSIHNALWKRCGYRKCRMRSLSPCRLEFDTLGIGRFRCSLSQFHSSSYHEDLVQQSIRIRIHIRHGCDLDTLNTRANLFRQTWMFEILFRYPFSNSCLRKSNFYQSMSPWRTICWQYIQHLKIFYAIKLTFL